MGIEYSGIEGIWKWESCVVMGSGGNGNDLMGIGGNGNNKSFLHAYGHVSFVARK